MTWLSLVKILISYPLEARDHCALDICVLSSVNGSEPPADFHPRPLSASLQRPVCFERSRCTLSKVSMFAIVWYTEANVSEGNAESRGCGQELGRRLLHVEVTVQRTISDHVSTTDASTSAYCPFTRQARRAVTPDKFWQASVVISGRSISMRRSTPRRLSNTTSSG